MEFNYLDSESEKLLSKLLACDFSENNEFEGETIEGLVQSGYVKGISSKTLSDTKPKYIVTGLTQKGKSYFELKEKYEREKRKVTRREWAIAIISTVVGAVIGSMVTSLLTLFK